MKKLVFAAAFVLLVAGIYSCKKDSSKCTVNVRMTDAPGPYSAVNVDILRVEVSGPPFTMSTYSIMVKPGIYNLLDFSNGLDTLLGTVLMTPTTVEQIRLVLGVKNTIVLDGKIYDLSTPSADQTGLKIQVQQVLEAGVTYNFLLDFDARNSIIELGNGKYKLKPVIRVIDTAVSGAIRGKISPAGTVANVEVTLGSETYSASVNSGGDFILRGLPAGTYAISIIHSLPGSPKNLTDISVTIGSTTDLGTISLN